MAKPGLAFFPCKIILVPLQFKCTWFGFSKVYCVMCYMSYQLQIDAATQLQRTTCARALFSTINRFFFSCDETTVFCGQTLLPQAPLETQDQANGFENHSLSPFCNKLLENCSLHSSRGYKTLRMICRLLAGQATLVLIL